jgi:hypothetical protein
LKTDNGSTLEGVIGPGAVDPNDEAAGLNRSADKNNILALWTGTRLTVGRAQYPYAFHKFGDIYGGVPAPISMKSTGSSLLPLPSRKTEREQHQILTP